MAVSCWHTVERTFCCHIPKHDTIAVESRIFDTYRVLGIIWVEGAACNECRKTPSCYAISSGKPGMFMIEDWCSIDSDFSTIILETNSISGQ
jgi:hypothetical protein